MPRIPQLPAKRPPAHKRSSPGPNRTGAASRGRDSRLTRSIGKAASRVTRIEKPPVPPITHRRGSTQSQVFLVGAGPGDPELLTLRALRLMNDADVVVYDSLVSDEVLALIPARAERVYAGKQSGAHSLKQEAINTLLVDLARRGKKVMRLKGGDPFIFGRGGEEMQFLAEHGVRFEIVPGVTSASGAACYAGIPLTHRDYAQSLVIATGHPRKGACELDWGMLARPEQTVVIYMGLGQIRRICAELVGHGRGADTPVAVVERATTAAQRVIIGTLRTIAAKCVRKAVRSPSLIIVGEVVNLHGRLCWFEPAAAGRRKAVRAHLV